MTLEKLIDIIDNFIREGQKGGKMNKKLFLKQGDLISVLGKYSRKVLGAVGEVVFLSSYENHKKYEVTYTTHTLQWIGYKIIKEEDYDDDGDYYEDVTMKEVYKNWERKCE